MASDRIESLIAQMTVEEKVGQLGVFADMVRPFAPDVNPEANVRNADQVLQQVREGDLLAAPTDSPVIQARIALDLAVRGLQGEVLPAIVSPQVEMLDAKALQRFDLERLAPPERYRMTTQALPD